MKLTQNLVDKKISMQRNHYLLAGLCFTIVIWSLIFVVCSLSTQIIWLPMRGGADAFMAGYAVDAWCLGVFCWMLVWMNMCVKSLSSAVPVKVDGSKFNKNLRASLKIAQTFQQSRKMHTSEHNHGHPPCN